MKGDKGPFGKNWGGLGGYREDEERKKKAVRLRIFAALAVILILGGSWFLFSGKPAPEQSAQEEVAVKVETPPAVPEKKEEVRRRNIYDRNLRELAISFKVDSIYVKPLEFDNIERTVALLAETLGLDEKDVLAELKTQRTYKWVVKNISPEKATKVAAYNLPGVYFYEQEQRFAPNRANTAQIVGEVKDGHGLSGIELFYDNLLLGGSMDSQAAGTAAGEGKGVVLTLDAGIQMLMEQEMAELRNEMKASDSAAEDTTGVSAMLMDPASGEILSYVRLPSFGGSQESTESGLERGERILGATIHPGALALIFKAAADFEQKPAEAAPEEATPENIKPIEPRVMKKIGEVKEVKEGRTQSKSAWAELPDGTYAAEWLAALLAKQQATATGMNDFSDFGKIVGRAGPCTVDLPGENGGRDSGLGLLCGFAALVNGGTGVSPHFLKATLSEDGKPEEWPWPLQENKVIGPETSRDLVLFLREKSHPAGQMFFADVLQPVIVQPDQAAKEEAPAPPPAQEAEGKSADKGQPDGESKAEVKVLTHCNAVALAAAPLANPELVMLIVVNDATVDLTKPSAVRQHAESFLQAAMKQRNRKEAVKGAAESISRQEIFQRWLMKNKLMGFDVTAGVKDDAETMIDMRGMSIRKALQELNRFDVKVVVEGSGIVKKQHPAPGSKVAEGSLVVLKAEAKR